MGRRSWGRGCSVGPSSPDASCVDMGAQVKEEGGDAASTSCVDMGGQVKEESGGAGLSGGVPFPHRRS